MGKFIKGKLYSLLDESAHLHVNTSLVYPILIDLSGFSIFWDRKYIKATLFI